MNVLVLGGGGREHTLVWKLKQSPEVKKIYCIPGNAGIAQDAECLDLPLTDFTAIEQFLREKEIGFTVVGPEQPLVAGIADFLQAKGHAVFGPNQSAARLEGSKIFAKRFMEKHGIPTAHFAAFEDYSRALDYLHSLPEGPVVVKADGLAAGKGSVVCPGKEEAQQALEQMMVQNVFSGAGKRVVIEEFMIGHEASLFVLTDGKDYLVLPPAQDYKRVYDGDRGPNTGGMGSYALTPVLTRTMKERAIREIVEPTLNALQEEGIDYRGILYCGLMVTNKGPRVVEFNCRFGDPETQVVLPLLENDLLELLMASAQGRIGEVKLQVRPEYAVCVIAASGGYPGSYEKGKPIQGLEAVDPDVLVFHAGTRREGGQIVTSGGRVLGVTARHQQLKAAADKAYRNLRKIQFPGMHYRTDIAERGWKLIT